jgi:hypothetical protein
MPFYAAGALVRLEHREDVSFLVESDAGMMIRLTGLAYEIQLANESAGLFLTADNVVAYAMFFCGFLNADNGEAFPIVARRGNWALDGGTLPEDLAPTIEADNAKEGRYLIRAYMAHCRQMFRALLFPGGSRHARGRTHGTNGLAALSDSSSRTASARPCPQRIAGDRPQAFDDDLPR